MRKGSLCLVVVVWFFVVAIRRFVGEFTCILVWVVIGVDFLFDSVCIVVVCKSYVVMESFCILIFFESGFGSDSVCVVVFCKRCRVMELICILIFIEVGFIFDTVCIVVFLERCAVIELICIFVLMSWRCWGVEGGGRGCLFGLVLFCSEFGFGRVGGNFLDFLMGIVLRSSGGVWCCFLFLFLNFSCICWWV